MTDPKTLTREQAEALQRRIAEWRSCTWEPYAVTPVIEAAAALVATCLAVMDAAKVSDDAAQYEAGIARTVHATNLVLESRLAQLEAENAALRRYMRHDSECALRINGPNRCTCGLTALLSSPAEAAPTQDAVSPNSERDRG